MGINPVMGFPPSQLIPLRWLQDHPLKTVSVLGNCEYSPSLLSVKGNISLKGEERSAPDRYLSVLKFRSLNEYLTSDLKNSEIARLMRHFYGTTWFHKGKYTG